MGVHDRYESGLFDTFILLADLVLYCCYVGGLDESVGDEVDMRIGGGIESNTEA